MTIKFKCPGTNLYISRNLGQSIILKFGELEARITVWERDGNYIRLAIQAPKEIRIDRCNDTYLHGESK
jgi:sRNA-binding carbon storage regulator CsrA